MVAECLVVGPEGAGKTLLIRKLEELCTSKRKKTSRDAEASATQTDHASIGCQELHHTIPTVGVNLARLKLLKGLSCNLRESGGQMAPLWPNCYKDCSMVIFVIDSSNQVQVSASTILLLEVLSAPGLQDKPVLVFFNKTECPLGLGLVEYKSVMRLEDIVSHARQTVSVVEGSCWTGDGIPAILEWLIRNAEGSQ